MTVEGNGPEQGQAAAQSPGAGTPDPGAATPPAGTAAPNPQGQGQSDEFVRIPKRNLQAYGGDFHAALEQAKKAQHFEPWEGAISRLSEHFQTPDQFQAFLDQVFTEAGEDEGDEGGDSGQAGQQQDPAAQALTPEAIQKMVADGVQNALGQFQQTQKQAEAQQALQRGMQLEATHRTQALKDAGIEPPKDGETSHKHAVAEYLFDQMIEQAKRNTAPPWMKGQKLQQYLTQPATESELKQAAEQFQSAFKDLQQGFAAGVAMEQQTTPPASLGDGHGGNPQPKDTSKMSHEQLKRAVTQGLPSVHEE